MLKSINLDNKTYEELMAEAITQIPLYSSEWTNFNTSDPGITLLQNLTSFNLLQQSRINEVTEPVRRKLLRLLGFEAEETAPSRVLIEAVCDHPLRLPAQTKLTAGELCFECDEAVELSPWRISTVYTEAGGEWRDISYLLSREVPTETPVFGAPVQTGRALYCILDGLPDISQPLHLYARVRDAALRNPFAQGQELRFAQLNWQVYTAEGWLDLEARDETHGFLVSGEIVLAPPRGEPAVFEGAQSRGYAIRCVLEREEYDVIPRLHSLTANLIEMTQRDTLSKVYTFDGGRGCRLYTQMADYDCIFVYCREERDGPYREYKCYNGVFQEGRLYRREEMPDGTLRITFDKKRFGFGPWGGAAAVKIICCTDEMVLHRSLGQVFGYDNQEIEIDQAENILAADFSVLMRTTDPDGQHAYRFVPPESEHPDDPFYLVQSLPGRLLVTRPGAGDDCRFYLADCAVTAGGEGNVREENLFTPLLGSQLFEGVRFTNPGPGRGGVTSQSVEELRRLFIAALRAPTAAVMASDYEKIIQSTPGLCIHKVKAVVDDENNLVKIAIKPYTEDRLPILSPIYLRQIARHHEGRRMITTKVEFLQPRYLAIDVKATIYVKSYYERAREEIEALLTRELDTVNSERPFGETIFFDKLYRMLEELPCVDSIYELLLIPRSRSAITMEGSDIRLADDCLCYPGRLALELQNSHEGGRRGHGR